MSTRWVCSMMILSSLQSGQTPLMLACKNLDITLVQLFLENHANPSLQCNVRVNYIILSSIYPNDFECCPYSLDGLQLSMQVTLLLVFMTKIWQIRLLNLFLDMKRW